MENYGIISLLPVMAILILAITTKRTLFAMTCGSLIGAIILGKLGFFNTWIEYFGRASADGTLQWLVLVIVLFGILIMIFEKSNAVNDFARWAERFINSRKKSLVFTFILGMIIFLDDYLHNLAVGTTMKNITDRYKVPRTMLGYIVNSNAAALCVLVPLSTWAVFFSGLFEAQGITVNGSGMGAYIQSIPFIFYGWFAVLIVFLVAIGKFPMLGRLRKDNKRALEKGQLFPEEYTKEDIAEVTSEAAEAAGSKKPMPFNFLIPLLVMIGVTITTAIVAELDILIGTAAALVVAVVLYMGQRIMNFKDVCVTAFEGIKSMLFVLILSFLAFTVQNLNMDLGLAEYVIEVTKPLMSGAFLPMVVFLVCAVYAYASGCFWDLAIIITPIVIPLALAMDVSPILAGAAVFSGAAFGSNTCLYGDGVILAARATGLKPINLMLTTLPYAGIAGGLSAICYLIFGFIMH